MESASRIAVAGATGRLGHHLVDVLNERGHDVVPMSRATGVDLATGEGLEEALKGVETVIDAASWPTPDQQAATDFFEAETANLHRVGREAGVKQVVLVSIIGCDRFPSGYNAAKAAQERAMAAAPLPVRVLRTTQFHEFVAELVKWATQDGTSYLPEMRTQLISARTVAEALADLATGPGPDYSELAGPQEENLVEAARMLVRHRGDQLRVEAVKDPSDPEQRLWVSGASLPGPGVPLAGPTYQEWLDSAA